MLKKNYFCDLCGDEIKNYDKGFGIRFRDLMNFELTSVRNTDSKHICDRCAVQLKEQLKDMNFKR